MKMQKTVESAKVEARKQGVLSLEIQNYEVSHNLVYYEHYNETN